MGSSVSFYIIMSLIMYLGIFTYSSICVTEGVIFDGQSSSNLANVNLFKCFILLTHTTCMLSGCSKHLPLFLLGIFPA